MSGITKYPNRIRIGFADYDLKFTTVGLRDSVDGLHHSMRQQISIANDLTGQYRAFVILHEILHGCFFASALSDANLDDKEELIVDALAKQIAGVIRDNPNLLKALVSDLKGDE